MLLVEDQPKAMMAIKPVYICLDAASSDTNLEAQTLTDDWQPIARLRNFVLTA